MQQSFVQAAHSLLCRKASSDPHDFQYPSAAFEEVSFVSKERRPYILASTLHALHGTASNDSKTLIAARTALEYFIYCRVVFVAPENSFHVLY